MVQLPLPFMPPVGATVSIVEDGVNTYAIILIPKCGATEELEKHLAAAIAIEFPDLDVVSVAHLKVGGCDGCP